MVPGPWFLVPGPSSVLGLFLRTDRGPRTESGYTFIELLVVSTIVLILASAIMPLARVTATRQREAELRRDLREMRTAIDKYKDAADTGQIGPTELKPDGEGYPADLETLVEGVTAANDQTGRKLKFLRRVPRRSPDPHGRLGPALLPGCAERHALGRRKCLRRAHDVPGHRARRDEIQ